MKLRFEAVMSLKARNCYVLTLTVCLQTDKSHETDMSIPKIVLAPNKYKYNV